MRGPGKDDFYLQDPGKANYGASKGHYEMSWIWLVPQSKSEADMSSSEQVFDEGLRVEWSKSQPGKRDGKKKLRYFRRRCDEQLFTTSGSKSGGLKKIYRQ